MFLWEGAPNLLARKGYAIDVRRDCLALAMWLLAETHAAGEERMLAPAKPRRKSSATAAPTLLTVAPNLAAAYNAELLVLGGADGSGVRRPASPPNVVASGSKGSGETPDVTSRGGVGSFVTAGKGDGNGSVTSAAAAAAIAAESSRDQYRTAHLSLVGNRFFQ